MFPASGVHHLLLDGIGVPLVATSGNLAGQPLVAAKAAAETRLGEIADSFLHNDRDIVHAVDDGVFRIVDNKPRTLRLARGVAPLELDLPVDVEFPTLAVGGHLKSAIALAWGTRIVVSPHIGDLDSIDALERFAALSVPKCGFFHLPQHNTLCTRYPLALRHMRLTGMLRFC